MTAATIDLNSLDELFNNQKKLNDMFNSAFDDDLFLDSPTAFSDYAEKQENTTYQASSDSFNNNFTPESNIPGQKIRGYSYFVLPIVELIAIYYGISYFA